MAAPFEDVHFHQRRIGQLQEGNFIDRDFMQAAERVTERQNMEAIENNTERRAIHRFYSFPRLIPMVDVRAPG